MVCNNAVPVATGRNVISLVIKNSRPLQGWPAYNPSAGVYEQGLQIIPSQFCVKACARSLLFIHGAPQTVKGFAVPRPSFTFIPSSKPMPGYSRAVVIFCMAGEVAVNHPVPGS